MNNQRLTGLPTPGAASDPATKAYADAISAGLDPHGSVKVATVSNITDLNSAGATIDGITLAVNDRVLVKNQTSNPQNGIYSVQSLSPTVLARATDANEDAELTGGSFTFVEQGTHVDQGWVATHNGTPTLGSSAITFTQFSGPGAAQPDASTTVKGITKLSVAPATASNPIAVGDNDVRIGDVFNVLSYGAVGNGTTDDTAAIRAAIAAAVPVNGKVFLPPNKNFGISGPLDVVSTMLEGVPGRSRITALAGFTGNQMIRNWTDADYEVGETDHSIPPAATAGGGVWPYWAYFPQIRGLYLVGNAAVDDLTLMGLLNVQETARISEIIMDPDGGTDYVGLELFNNAEHTVGSSLEHRITAITCYSDGWKNELLVHQASGVHIDHWTTSPSAHSGSVFDISDTLEVALDRINMEGYVDPALSGNTDLAMYRLRDVSSFHLSNGHFTCAGGITLQHPVVYSSNSNGAGYGINSPKVTCFTTYYPGSTSFASGVPMIKDRSQSTNSRDIWEGADKIRNINHYDGNSFSAQRESGVPVLFPLHENLAASNPGFETDSAGYSGLGCTVARSTAQSNEGAASLALTASGSNAYIGAVNPVLPKAGHQYLVRVAFRPQTSGDYTFQVHDGPYNWGVGGATLALTGGVWYEFELAFTPGGTSSGGLTLRLDKSSGTFNGEVVYMDDVFVMRTS